MLKFSAIICKSVNDVIGCGSAIPESKIDKLHFKRVTEYSPDNRKNLLICGRNTWHTLPNSIANDRRDILVLGTATVLHFYPSVIDFDSLYKLCLEQKDRYYKFFVIGGAKTYDYFFEHNLIDELFLTLIPIELDRYQDDTILKLTLTQFNLESQSESCSDVTYLDKKYQDVKIEFQKWNRRPQFESSYLNIVNEILTIGTSKETRNGFTKSINDISTKIDLADGFPIVTTRKIFFKGIVEELLWIMSGSTDTTKLQEKGVNIWNYHSSRQYLDSIGLFDLPENQIGPGYGKQLRDFNGFDQLQYVIKLIKTEPNSRRIFINLWNPPEINRMALPPCHVSYQFTVTDDKRLSCHLYQRSWDILLGWNVTTAALLTHILAVHCDLTVGTLTHTICDVHIYNVNIDKAITMIRRVPYRLPTLTILNKHESIDRYRFDDFKLSNYKYHESINLILS